MGQSVTTEAEYTWCQDILNEYKNEKVGAQHKYYKPQSFVSQYKQDWFLYSSMFANMKQTRGLYVDLAANHWKTNSNSYFFDKCLSWNGICIEAEPMLKKNLVERRSCDVVSTCIWSEPKNMTFMSNHGGGMTGLKDFNKLNNAGTELNMECTTLQKVFNERNINHIDYISLDIEGSELQATHSVLQALQSIDFDQTQIDIFTIEMNNKKVNEFMNAKGYIHKMQLHEDAVFIHQAATQKLLWIDDYLNRSNLETYDASEYHNIVAIPIYKQ